MLRKNFSKIIISSFVLLIIVVVTTIITATLLRDAPTEAVKSVEIVSDNYNNPGSYKIDNSAKWTGLNKAQIKFDVDSVPKMDERYKDIVLIIDTSSSMYGTRLSKVKENAVELVNYILNDEHNRVALITFDTTSEILSNFTNNKDEVVREIQSLTNRGATNYNAALLNLSRILTNYQKDDDKDLVVLFLTDGEPNEDTPNQVGTYGILKSKYPYMTIQGVQYEMGSSVSSSISNISDNQWTANTSDLRNVLFEAILHPLLYEKYEVVEYIDADYFEINNVDDIKVTIGSVRLENEDGFQKIIWNLGDSFITGGAATMTIDVNLKDEFTNIKGFYSTNYKEIVTSKIDGSEEVINESTLTPVLKNYYNVIYNSNPPEGCELEEYGTESNFIFTNITKKQEELSCDGYNFHGWQIVDDDVVRINDDVFYMPEHDVNINATWSKPSISKSMDGKIKEATTLYRAIESEAENGTEAKLYESETNDGNGSENVYYYNGNVTKNNVNFAGYCWKILRTTDTGGVKLVYNGKPDAAGKCGTDRGTDNNIGYGTLQTLSLSSSYLYGDSYTYDKETKMFTLKNGESKNALSADNQEEIIGKYTCRTTSESCSNLYYVDSYVSGSTAYVIPLNNSTPYYQIGSSAYNSTYTSPAFVGYMNSTNYPTTSKGMTGSIMTIGECSLDVEEYYASSYTIVTQYSSKYYKLSSPRRLTATSQKVPRTYTLSSTNASYTSSSIKYLISYDLDAGYTSYYKCIYLSSGKNLSEMTKTYKFGTSLIDNHNGTYTISGSITSATNVNWYSVYPNFVHKYTCGSDSLTCTTPHYTTSTSDNYYYYVVAIDYKYGKSFSYNEDTGVYTLSDTTNFYDFPSKYGTLSNYHYTCFNTTGTCDKLYYIYYAGSSTAYYVEVNGNEHIDTKLNKMLNSDDVNTNNSSVKNLVDLWYKINMNKYADYLEDTVFCNNRSISNTGGWTEDGGSVTSNLLFSDSTTNTNLSCSKTLDKFSVSDDIGNGDLTYPVGLISVPEANLWGTSASKTGAYWWTSSPYSFSSNSANVALVNSGGGIGASGSSSSYGVRPVISLAPGTVYESGNGTIDYPFYVATDYD